MNLFTKVAIGISGTLALIFFVLFQFSKSMDMGEPVDIIYPASGLSDNLFVSQNSTYEPNTALPEIYQMRDIPYLVDLPSGNTADVGTGHIVQGNDNLVFYVSQISESVDPHSAIIAQYPKVVYMNYSQENSYSMTLKEEQGFMNGLPGTYFVDHLLVSKTSGTETQNAYVLGYCFEPETEMPYKMIVSVATTIESTENFETCKQLLDAVAYTVRYDSKLDSTQKESRDKAAREQAAEEERLAREREKAEQEALKKAAEEESVKKKEADEARMVGLVDEAVLPVSVTKDFRNLSILITWKNPCKDTTIRFTSDDGYLSVAPDTQGDTMATINIGSCTEGEYGLTFTKYSSLGDVNMKLIENGR